MGKSSRSKGSANIGNGAITPTQIAFIVDRYLYDNRFSKTRTLFRSEASSLLSNSPVREVLKSYMTLDDILKHYVCLKEQKVAVDQERAILDKEKLRVQNLLQGMQNVMNTYNANLNAPPPPPPVPAPTSQPKIYNTSSSGCSQYSTPNVMSVSLLGNKRVDFRKFSTPLTSQPITGKRKGPEVYVGAPPATRKARITSAQENSTANETNQISQAGKSANDVSSQTPSETHTLAKNSSANELMTGQGSSVAKCLFNKADSSLPTSSTQKHASPGSDNSKSNSPRQEATPTKCTVVTKERFTISPLKQITSYTVERSQLISSSSPVRSNLRMSNKRDHVKGRLNFDDTDTEMCLEAPATADLASTSPSGSEPEVDLTDIDFSILGENFSFSELLVDFDLVCEGEGNIPNAHVESNSGSSPESGNRNLEPDQVMSEHTSTLTEAIQGKDMINQGDGAKTTENPMHTSLSPAKSCR